MDTVRYSTFNALFLDSFLSSHLHLENTLPEIGSKVQMIIRLYKKKREKKPFKAKQNLFCYSVWFPLDIQYLRSK